MTDFGRRTILSYPLAPFFVLFCNVVGTSDARDFRLLQDVVESVSSLVIENKYVERLRRLCNALLSLCRPLVHSNLNPDVMQERQPVPALISDEDVTPAYIESATMQQMHAEASTPSKEIAGEGWQDDMMWQLFQAQPSLDWFNSDILDPLTWDLSTPN